MEPIPNPIEMILSDIEAALAAKLWYLAIAVTLSLPDICSLLERDDATDGWSKEHKYAEWYDAWVKDKLNGMTGVDCYQLRGGVLHKGRFQHTKLRYNRFVFVVPDWRNNRFQIQHKYDDQFVITYDVMTFCEALISSARDWAKVKDGDLIVEKNLENLVRLRPNGFAPSIVGVPVIA